MLEGKIKEGQTIKMYFENSSLKPDTVELRTAHTHIKKMQTELPCNDVAYLKQTHHMNK